MLSVVLIAAQLLGALHEAVERDQQRQRRQFALEWTRIQKGPQAEFRLVNRSGKPLDAVLVDCASDPRRPLVFRDISKRVGPYGAEPTPLHRRRWPDPFTLKSVTLVRGKEEIEHPLNFPCPPGGRVLVVVDEKGGVSAQVDK